MTAGLQGGERRASAPPGVTLPTGGLPSGPAVELTAADGVRLRAVHLPGPADGDVGVVLVPGFSCSWDKPFVRRVARWLTPYAGVVVLDLRGHGGSGGRSTLGDREVLDVEAALAHTRALGYARVVTLGFSMGGAAVLRHAGLRAGSATPPEAVVSVSATSRWWRLETPRMRRLARLTLTRAGRLVTRVALRTRVDPRARYGSAPAPAEVVGAIAPTPLLIVHGGRDGYLTTGNARDLHAAAGEPSELWIWPDYGHAELALDEPLTARIGAHLTVLLDRRPSGPVGGEPGPDGSMGAP